MWHASCVLLLAFTSIQSLIIQEESSDYGIDWSGPIVADEAVERVTVPEVQTYLNPDQLSFLKSFVDPLEQCDDHGKALYVTARVLVREMLD